MARSLIRLFATGCVCYLQKCSAFVPEKALSKVHAPRWTTTTTTTTATNLRTSPVFRHEATRPQLSSSSMQRVRAKTHLQMYNLPPSGGGGGGGKNEIRQILTSVATVVGIVAFFASPLGTIFFALLNSFVVLTLLFPVVLWAGFQGWQFFNTIEGPCPQCGAPVRVLKEENSPSICLNCGTFVQATADKSAVDFYREEDQVIVDEGYTASIWDSLVNGPMGATSAPCGTSTPIEA